MGNPNQTNSIYVGKKHLKHLSQILFIRCQKNPEWNSQSGPHTEPFAKTSMVSPGSLLKPTKLSFPSKTSPLLPLMSYLPDYSKSSSPNNGMIPVGKFSIAEDGP